MQLQAHAWASRAAEATVLFLLVLSPASGGVSVSERTGPTGQPLYVLENAFVRLEVNPATGGRAESLLHKATRTPLIRPATPGQAAAGNGLFIDRFWGDRQLREFEKNTYAVDVLDEAPAKASLTLTGSSQGLVVRKTVTLERGVSGVGVRYVVTNEGEEDYTGRLWTANALSPGGEPESIRLFFPYSGHSHDHRNSPGELGIPVLEYRPGQSPSDGNHFINDPVAGWAAVLSDAGVGAAVRVDFGFLERFYSCHPQPGSGAPIPTVEWWTRPILLPPLARGKREAAQHPELEDPLANYVFRTQWRLIPVSGLQHVSGVGEGIVGALRVERGKLSVSVLSDRAREAVLKIERRRLPAPGEAETLDEWPATLRPDAVESKAITVEHVQEGTYVYRARVFAAPGDRELAAFEAPFTHGESSGEYTPPPTAEKDTRFEPGLSVPPLGTQFDTPCVPWAKPLDRPVKLLVITAVATHREIGELTRCLDLDLTLVEVARAHIFRFSGPAYASWKPPDPEALLRAALEEEHDAILIAGSLYWEQIPEDLRGAIMDRVSQGTGLVYVNPARLTGTLQEVLRTPVPDDEADHYLMSGIPWEDLPGVPAPITKTCRLHRHGEGRIIRIGYSTVPNGKVWRESRAVTPIVYDDGAWHFPYWHYYYSFVCRSLLLAAGRVPAIRVVEGQVDGEARQLTLSVRCAKATETPVPVVMETWAVDRRGRRSDAVSRRTTLAAGDSRIDIPLGGMGLSLRGPHFLNVVMRGAGGAVLHSFTATHRTETDVSLGEVILDSTALPAGRPVAGTLSLAGRDGRLPGGARVRHTLTDMHGRVLARSEEAIPATEQAPQERPFSLELSVPPYSTLCRLETELLRDGTVVDYARRHVSIRRPSPDDLTFTIWGMQEANHWTRRKMAERMREIGFDVDTGLHISSTKAEEVPAAARTVMTAGLEYTPMAIHRLAVWQKQLKDPARDPCLSSPEYADTMRSDITKHVGWARDFLCPFYFVADENSLGHYSSAHDFCHSPHCLALFRQRLRERYDTVEALNEVWRTRFAVWDEVKPLTFDQAKSKDWFPPWFEHRSFMFEVFSGAIAREKNLLEEVCPGGRLAVSGMGMPTVHNGFDWYRMQQSLDHVVAYLRPALADVMRSFRRGDRTLSAWNGYGSSEDALRQRIWHQVLNGFFHPSYWFHRYLMDHGDDALSPAGEAFQRIIGEVRDSGVGKLLMAAEWVPSEIGMHQSTASLIAARITGTSTPVSDTVFGRNLNGWAELLRDMGLQPPTVFSTEQLENGALKASGVRVFVLPLSQVLSDRETEALVSFVEAGGTLVADARPGVYGTNAVPRETNPLHAVFGVEYSAGAFERPQARIAVRAGPESVTLPLPALEPGVTLNEAKPLGASPGQARTKPVEFGGMKIRTKDGGGASVPSFIVRRAGRGAAVYLNTLFDEYGDMRKRGDAVAPIVQAMQAALEAAAFRPATAAQVPPGTEVIRYRDGGTRYIGVCRHPDSTSERDSFTVTLGGTFEVVDLLAGEHVGRSDRIEGSVSPGQTRVFAATPEPMGRTGLDLAFEEGSLVCKVTVSDAAGKPAAGGGRLTVYGPDGSERGHYTRDLAVRGTATVRTPLGLDERAGRWRVVVRDTLTGDSDEKSVEIRP